MIFSVAELINKIDLVLRLKRITKRDFCQELVKYYAEERPPVTKSTYEKVYGWFAGKSKPNKASIKALRSWYEANRIN